MPLMKKYFFTQPRVLGGLLLFACISVSAPRINAQAAPAAAATQERQASYATARDHARATAKEWLARGVPGFNIAVAVDGKIITNSRDGTFWVVKAGAKYELLAENKLQDNFTASPVVSGGKLYLRGFNSLYAIAAK